MLGNRGVAEGYFEMVDATWSNGQLAGQVLYFTPATKSTGAIPSQRYPIAQITGTRYHEGWNEPFSFQWHAKLPRQWLSERVAMDFARLRFLQLQVQMNDGEKIIVPFGPPQLTDRLTFSPIGDEQTFCEQLLLPANTTNEGQFDLVIVGPSRWAISVVPGRFPLAGQITRTDQTAPVATFLIQSKPASHSLVTHSLKIHRQSGIRQRSRQLLSNAQNIVRRVTAQATKEQSKVTYWRQQVRQMAARAKINKAKYGRALATTKQELVTAQETFQRGAATPIRKSLALLEAPLDELETELASWQDNQPATARNLLVIQRVFRKIDSLNDTHQELFFGVNTPGFENFVTESIRFRRQLDEYDLLTLLSQITANDKTTENALRHELRYKVTNDKAPLDILVACLKETSD